MKGPKSGVEFLAQFKEFSDKKKASFQDLSNYFEWKARDKGIPMRGQFELTPLCNLSCRMCYVHLIPEQLKGTPVLPVSAWKNLMYQAFQAGMLQAVLTGGECLAYPGFDELYLYLHSLGCQVCVMTNGVLLDEKRIQFFREHKPSDIQITLYGWNDDVYERVTGKRVFTTVSHNIMMAREAGLSVTVTVTPNVYLGEDVLETVRCAKSLCRDVAVNSVVFKPREETGRSEQADDPELDLYIRTYRLLNELEGRGNQEFDPKLLPEPGGPCHTCAECGLKCGGGRSGFMVNWKGILQPCNRLDMIQAHPLDDGFKAAWEYVNRKANEYPQVPECDGCAYEEICSNCAANMMIYAEPGKQPIGLCERTKYLVQNGIRQLPECE